MRWLLLLLIRAYQYGISPLMPPHCRHAPSCSEYAATAILQHGLLRGGSYALRRLFRCHPWGTSGYDPVPGTSPTHQSCSCKK
ncbi:membrane protein insertion efficiency factor YidD [Halomonadaceae bacterium KBTZ08]